MGKRDKDDTLEDYKKLTDEIIIKKVNEIFRSRPDNYIAALEEIGFKCHEEKDDEEIEERTVKPNNKSQRKLVTYFEGEEDASEMIFATYITDRYAPCPNLPFYGTSSSYTHHRTSYNFSNNT